MRPSSLLPAPMAYKFSLVPEETWTSESALGTGPTASVAEETSRFLLSGLQDNKRDGRWSRKKSGLAVDDEERNEEAPLSKVRWW